MKVLERRLWKVIQRSIVSNQDWQRRIDRGRLLLGNDCTHPKEASIIWDWEHDDGYGKQTKIKGKRCQLCKKIMHRDLEP